MTTDGLQWEDGGPGDDSLIAAAVESGLMRGMPAGGVADAFSTVVYMGVTDTTGTRHCFVFLEPGHARLLAHSLIESAELLEKGTT